MPRVCLVWYFLYEREVKEPTLQAGQEIAAPSVFWLSVWLIILTIDLRELDVLCVT
jgi:hypothetical protein